MSVNSVAGWRDVHAALLAFLMRLQRHGSSRRVTGIENPCLHKTSVLTDALPCLPYASAGRLQFAVGYFQYPVQNILLYFSKKGEFVAQAMA
jgi:hypothetical protein